LFPHNLNDARWHNFSSGNQISKQNTVSLGLCLQRERAQERSECEKLPLPFFVSWCLSSAPERELDCQQGKQNGEASPQNNIRQMLRS